MSNADITDQGIRQKNSSNKLDDMLNLRMIIQSYLSIVDQDVAVSNLYELIMKDFVPENFNEKERKVQFQDLKNYIEPKLKKVQEDIQKLNGDQFIAQVKPFEINNYWGKLLKRYIGDSIHLTKNELEQSHEGVKALKVVLEDFSPPNNVVSPRRVHDGLWSKTINQDGNKKTPF